MSFQFEPCEVFRQRMMDKLRDRGTPPDEQKVLRYHLNRLYASKDHMAADHSTPDLVLKLNHLDLKGKVHELEVHLP